MRLRYINAAKTTHAFDACVIQGRFFENYCATRKYGVTNSLKYDYLERTAAPPKRKCARQHESLSDEVVLNGC